MRVVDLRSDTLSKPSVEMMKAMFNITHDDLGDDVYSEDPTVNSKLKAQAEIMLKCRQQKIYIHELLAEIRSPLI